MGAVYGAANFGTTDVECLVGVVALSLRSGAVRRTSVRLSDLRAPALARWDPFD